MTKRKFKKGDVVRVKDKERFYYGHLGIVRGNDCGGYAVQLMSHIDNELYYTARELEKANVGVQEGGCGSGSHAQERPLRAVSYRA